MRAFVIACLAIAAVSAEAEADAYTIGQVAAGLPWAQAVASGRAHNPGYISHISYPSNNVYGGYGAGVVSPVAATYSAYPSVYSSSVYGSAHYIGKRSADADSEADAYTIGQVAAGLPYANAVATGHAHNPGYVRYTSYPSNNIYGGYASNAYRGYAAHVAAPVATYSGYPSVYGAAHYIGKRSADSEADAYTIGQVAAGLPYANAVATGHAHNPGYVRYTSYPSNNIYRGYANNVYGGYAAQVAAPVAAYSGYPSVYGAAHYIGKRSADSEADAYTIGQVAAGLPYANAVATGHAHNPGYVRYTSYPSNNIYGGYAAQVASPVAAYRGYANIGYNNIGYTGAYYG